MNRINEIGDTPKGQYMLGRLQARNNSIHKGETDRDIEKYAKQHWVDDGGKRIYGTNLDKSYNNGYNKEFFDIVKPQYQSVADAIDRYKKRHDESKSMDKGKTTKILSGGAYIGKDGKRHEWRKIHGYKPKKITDDNWMEYGMPADEETNESKNMNKKLIRLTESDLHKIVKESVNKILREGFADDNHEGFPYMVVTYNGEKEVDRQYVTLPRQGLCAYDDEVPFTLGSNQALIELD